MQFEGRGWHAPQPGGHGDYPHGYCQDRGGELCQIVQANWTQDRNG